MGVAETSGVSFTIFHLRGLAYQWWRTYELGSLAEADSLTWTQFSDMFLREYVPQSLRDAWRAEFEQLCQGSMTVSEYTVIGIARRLEGMLTRDREEREAKKSRESGTYSGTLALTTARQARGYMGRPVHSALLAVNGAPSTTRPQDPYYAPPVSSVPHTRGASSGQSSRLAPSQSHHPCPLRSFFECGDTRHLVRDCPRFKRGAPPQLSQAPRAPPGPQAMIVAPTTSPPAQLDRGGGRTCRGRPRGGVQARYYALPARMEVVASYSVIIVTLPTPGLPQLERRGTLDHVPSRVVLFLNADRIVEKGCDAYLAYARYVSVDTPTIESVIVVRDYSDVFPADLPSMPPDRDIDFGPDRQLDRPSQQTESNINLVGKLHSLGVSGSVMEIAKRNTMQRVLFEKEGC
ncbi:uncharacterized protein [Nicotiana tomentosiformis]|uniref:uncharacterized protein n=1 Tax=Nicotiana tomentosiformis TaxID=4098 RepID=UPI00388C79DA